MSIDVKYLREVAKFSDESARIEELFKTLNLQAELLCVGAGQFVSPEVSMSSDILFWILEGEAVFEAGDEVLVLTANTSLLVTAGDSVGIINESDHALTVLRVMGPAGF